MSPRKTTPLALCLLAQFGCSTPPPVMNCPAPPQALMQPLPGLLQIPDGAPLSTVAAVVAENYTRHHETRAQCEGLQEWARSLDSEQP